MLTGMKGLPRPPGFHWIFVLLLSIVTLGIFADLWIIVQAVWARKIDPSSKALYLCIGGIVLSLAGFAAHGTPGAIIIIASIVLSVVGSFSVRDSLRAYMTRVKRTPVYLSGILTIFLGAIYLQYHMNRVRSLAVTAKC
jgi:uncharacterized membrane protein YjgN (DUF898 family)